MVMKEEQQLSSGPEGLFITPAYKVSKAEMKRICSKHSYLKKLPNFRPAQVMSLGLTLNGIFVGYIYHIVLTIHQPSHGIHPKDAEYGYRKDGKVAVMLARLMGTDLTDKLRDQLFSLCKGKPLEKMKARLLMAAIHHAWSSMNAGVIVDYIDKHKVKNIDEAKGLIDRVCEEIPSVAKHVDRPKYLATYWVHSQYIR